MKKLIILSIIFSFIFPLNLYAKEINVYSGQSIQNTVILSSNNDVIIIHPGIYKENI